MNRSKLSCNYRYIFLYNATKIIQHVDFCFVSYLCLLMIKLAHSKFALEEKNIKEYTHKK